MPEGLTQTKAPNSSEARPEIDRNACGALLHLLTKDTDYQWARPALVAHKIRAMQLQAGQPEKKGNKRGAAYAYNIKELRNREIDVARHAEHAYEQFVSRWQPRGPVKRRTGAANEERR